MKTNNLDLFECTGTIGQFQMHQFMLIDHFSGEALGAAQLIVDQEKRFLTEVRVRDLFVSGRLRRKGYGKLILEGVIAKATECRAKQIAASVHRGNKQALGFFSAMGFVEPKLKAGAVPVHTQHVTLFRKIEP